MKRILIAFLIIFNITCPVFALTDEAPKATVSHETWDILLKKHVRSNGLVDYKGFLADSLQLHQYLEQLSANPAARLTSQNEQLAYWINAYNAYTIALIIRHYPIKSINDIASKVRVPDGKSVWDVPFFAIGGKSYTLNEIEHQILRKKFAEPRIHFAINCASISCPNLRAEAFTANLLEKQLNEQAIAFVNDLAKNKLAKDKAQISSIFQWFNADFANQKPLYQFLNQYSKIPLTANTQIMYLEYDWSLNDVMK
jgi:Protein of unknown function, DUF547